MHYYVGNLTRPFQTTHDNARTDTTLWQRHDIDMQTLLVVLSVFSVCPKTDYGLTRTLASLYEMPHGYGVRSTYF